jgi:hypothetical protein
MTFASRGFALIVLAGLALAAAGCGSNNKGKIVGKWKATTLPGMSEDDKKAIKLIGEDNFALILEFTEAGKMTGTANITFLGKTENKEVISADYSLGTGDWVFFTNQNPPAKDGKAKSKDKITINGDTMTIDTEKGEKITLTRMK